MEKLANIGINGPVFTEGLVQHTPMGHWLADVHSGSFAPAFTLSFHDNECSRKPPNAHSLGRYHAF